MADDVEKMDFERLLVSFKLHNLKDSHQEALQNLVKGQNVFISQPKGSGKSLRHKQGHRLTRPAVYSGRIKDRPGKTEKIEPTISYYIIHHYLYIAYILKLSIKTYLVNFQG